MTHTLTLMESSPLTAVSCSRPLRTAVRAAIMIVLALAPASHVLAQQAAPAPQLQSDLRPYDEKLLRLSEILGAVHFLRELCGHNDGMQWRDRMNEILDAEGSSAVRRVKFTRAFNAGYRGYSRTYTTCTTTARTAVTRFITEGTELADGLMRGAP